MVTVIFTSRLTSTPESKDFDFAHNARTWLLLSGYLPVEDNSTFINVYTGDVAQLEFHK